MKLTFFSARIGSLCPESPVFFDGYPIDPGDEQNPMTVVMCSEAAAPAILTAEADEETARFTAISKELTTTFTRNVQELKREISVCTF